MKTPSITVLKKYLGAMAKTKAKYYHREALKFLVSQKLSPKLFLIFDPMVNMDYEYDLTELVPAIEEYIEKIARKETCSS